MNQFSNSKRILARLVSLEAWHEPLSKKGDKASLNVDIGFNEAYFGDGKEDKIRFKVRMKKAELIVLTDPDGSIKIPRKDVSRDTPKIAGTTTVKSNAADTIQTSATARGTVSNKGASGEISMQGAADFTRSQNTDTSLKLDHGPILTEHFTDECNNHGWRFTPATSELLEGNGWQGPKAVMGLLKNEDTKMQSAMKVQVKCRREDLHIYDISTQNTIESKWQSFRNIKQNAKMRLAVEAIKTALIAEGLGEPDLDNDHSIVFVADILAEEE